VIGQKMLGSLRNVGLADFLNRLFNRGAIQKTPEGFNIRKFWHD